MRRLPSPAFPACWTSGLCSSQANGSRMTPRSTWLNRAFSSGDMWTLCRPSFTFSDSMAFERTMASLRRPRATFRSSASSTLASFSFGSRSYRRL